MTTHKWLNLAQYGKGLIRYYDFYRMLVNYVPIDILRDPFNSQKGIWIVGDKVSVDESAKTIGRLVKVIQNQSKTKMLKEVIEKHGHSIRADYKKQILEIATQKLLEDVSKIEVTPEDLYMLSALKRIRAEYIKQTPSLKILKPFKCRTWQP